MTTTQFSPIATPPGQGMPVLVATPTPAPVVVTSARRRRRAGSVLPWIIAIGALAAIGVGGYLVWRQRQQAAAAGQPETPTQPQPDQQPSPAPDVAVRGDTLDMLDAKKLTMTEMLRSPNERFQFRMLNGTTTPKSSTGKLRLVILDAHDKAADPQGSEMWGQDLTKENDTAAWVVQQGDGNLVAYGEQSKKPLWASGVVKGNPKGYKTVMQDDGNLFTYEIDGQAVWASNTVRQAAALSQKGPYTLVNGDRIHGGQGLRVHDALTSPSGRYVLSQHMDGRLVVYDRARHVEHWASSKERELPLSDRYVTVLTPQGVLMTLLDQVAKWMAQPVIDLPTRGRMVSLILRDDGRLVIDVEGVGQRAL